MGITAKSPQRTTLQIRDGHLTQTYGKWPLLAGARAKISHKNSRLQQ